MAVFSRFVSGTKNIMDAIKHQEKVWPPPIPLVPKTLKSMDKSENSKLQVPELKDKTKYLTVNIKYNPNDENSNEYEEHIFKFTKGTAEE